MDKIKQLEEQCWRYVYPEAPVANPRGPHWEFDSTQFAQLVVLECCRVLKLCQAEPFPFDEEYACRLLKHHFRIPQ